MNVQPALRPATYQDVLDAPPHMVAEIIRGALHLQPRPRPRHSRSIKALSVKIAGPFDVDGGGPGGWEILIEPELHLGDAVVVPDLAGWRRERLPVLPDAVGITVVPDWVCEVLSPATRTLDLTDKRDLYREQGVAHLWLVDPEARTLEAFGLRDGLWVLTAALAGEAAVAVPPFEAAPFGLGVLWGG
jgi:hypothetical protein